MSKATCTLMGARETQFWSRWRVIACTALLALSLAACGPKEPDPNEMFGSSVTAMDHDPSDTFVRNVYVDGTWVGQGGTGGSIVLGGISLPYRWRPGLTAVVKWERCEPYGKNCRWTEKVVPIQKYDELAMSTWLHILPGNEVRLINSPYAPDHPEYPGPGYPTKDFFNMPSKPKDDTNEQYLLHTEGCAQDSRKARTCSDLQKRRVQAESHVRTLLRWH